MTISNYRSIWRVLTLIAVALAFGFGANPTLYAAWPNGPQAPLSAKIAPALAQSLAASSPDTFFTVIVTLNDQPVPRRLAQSRSLNGPDGWLRAMQTMTSASQTPLREFLDERAAGAEVQMIVPFWIFNGLSVTANAAVIEEIAARVDVRTVTPDAIDLLAVEPAATEPMPSGNLSLIHAPEMWQMGYTGQGIVVASLDTGVDLTHPELQVRWRGGSNSWFDPYNQHPDTPVDFTGHGTWTMGVMVAGNASGFDIGLAPGAQWIAARIFNDSARSTATAIHLAYQWILDPDGDPATADAPDVVNNSWAFAVPGCDLMFEPDLQALRAADILPVFAAGNAGPNPSTSLSPANNPSAFAVGAINTQESIYGESSRGPVGLWRIELDLSPPYCTRRIDPHN